MAMKHQLGKELNSAHAFNPVYPICQTVYSFLPFRPYLVTFLITALKLKQNYFVLPIRTLLSHC